MSEESIAVGRLKKRIAKLIKQRDFYIERCNHYRKVLDLSPYIEQRWTSYTEMKERDEKRKATEARVQEQAELIKRLLKEKGDG